MIAMIVNKVYIIFSVYSVSALNAPVNVASPSQSPTFITLSWEQSAGDAVDNYIIVYTYQGRCSDYTQPENMTTVNNGSARMYTLKNLQGFSDYVITVTAVNTGGGSTSDMITATTMANGMHFTLGPILLVGTNLFLCFTQCMQLPVVLLSQ